MGTRSFLALLLPASAVESAGRLLAGLRERHGDRDVKWVAPANLHLTLRFFGDLDAPGLERARAVVKERADAWEAIETRWQALGAFPSTRRAQIIWLGIDDERGALRALAADVERQLVRVGFGRGDKPFSAHVTLGRVRRGARFAWPAGSEGLTSPAAAFSISRMALMKSLLTPGGPVYTPLETADARHRSPGSDPE